jgi:hypothetical protein
MPDRVGRKWLIAGGMWAQAGAIGLATAIWTVAAHRRRCST